MGPFRDRGAEDDELRDLDAELDAVELDEIEEEDEEEFERPVGACAAGEDCRYGGTVYEDAEHPLEGRRLENDQLWHAGCSPTGAKHAKAQRVQRKRYARSAVAKQRASTAREV